jgi:hypothetical protein
MALGRAHLTFSLALVAVLMFPPQVPAAGEILEFFCRSCGYRERFVQGADPSDEARNIEKIIVVCERTRQIRTIKIPSDPKLPVNGEPLLARQYGTGQSDLLGIELPKFLVPGNTCPLFPITAYLERNICPVDGRPGLEFVVADHF